MIEIKDLTIKPLRERIAARDPSVALVRQLSASAALRQAVQAGGRVGSTLFTLSREPTARTQPVSVNGRKPITLSTKPLSAVTPMDDEIDEADFAELAKAVTA